MFMLLIELGCLSSDQTPLNQNNFPEMESLAILGYFLKMVKWCGVGFGSCQAALK